MPARRRHRLALAAAVVLAAALRLWGLDTGLPHPMTRPDEETVVGRTAMPAHGQFDLQWEPYPSAYIYLTWAWGEAAVRVGQVLGVVPRGDYASVLRAHLDRVILVDRVLSTVAATATVALVAALAGRAFGAGAGLAAAVLLATSFLHVRDSHFVKPDALLALAVLATVAAAAPLARAATVGRALRAGLALGAAAAMKYPAMILGAITYGAACTGGTARGWRRLVSAPGGVALATAAIVFVATSPFLFLNPTTFHKALEVLSIFFPQAAPVAAPTLPVIPGYPDWTNRAWWEGFVYHATFSLRHGTGLAFALLAPVAGAWGLAQRAPLPRLAALAAVLWYVVCGLSKVSLARYMTPILPLLVLLEAGALAAFAARFGGARRAALVLAVATLVVATEPLADSIAYDRLIARTDTRVLATRWMADHLPPGARVVVLGSQVWFWGAPQVPPGAVQVAGIEPARAAFVAARVQWVVTHEHALFSSRLDPAVMAELAPHLRLLADFDPALTGDAVPVFEPGDAYYVPIAGFAAVTRPGPHVRIYAFE